MTQSIMAGRIWSLETTNYLTVVLIGKVKRTLIPLKIWTISISLSLGQLCFTFLTLIIINNNWINWTTSSWQSPGGNQKFLCCSSRQPQSCWGCGTFPGAGVLQGRLQLIAKLKSSKMLDCTQFNSKVNFQPLKDMSQSLNNRNCPRCKITTT